MTDGLGTSSGQNTVRHGYRPYNPATVEKYLTIFQTVANVISVRTDATTPAMRPGFADKPLTYEDMLRLEPVAPPPGRREPKHAAN